MRFRREGARRFLRYPLERLGLSSPVSYGRVDIPRAISTFLSVVNVVILAQRWLFCCDRYQLTGSLNQLDALVSYDTCAKQPS